jgi:hypothetical protein
VKLDGDVGIIGNGAGLVASTLDVVSQAGGSRRTSWTWVAGQRRGHGDIARGGAVGPGGPVGAS